MMGLVFIGLISVGYCCSWCFLCLCVYCLIACDFWVFACGWCLMVLVLVFGCCGLFKVAVCGWCLCMFTVTLWWGGCGMLVLVLWLSDLFAGFLGLLLVLCCGLSVVFFGCLVLFIVLCVIGCYADSCICCLCVCSLVVIGWVCARRLLGLTVNSIVVVTCLYGFVCAFGFGFVFIVIL